MHSISELKNVKIPNVYYDILLHFAINVVNYVGKTIKVPRK